MPEPTSVDYMLQVVHDRALRVANLFELDNGLWQCNVTDGARVWEFGRATTAAGAIAAALFESANGAPAYYPPDKPPTYHPNHPTRPVRVDGARPIGARPKNLANVDDLEI